MKQKTGNLLTTLGTSGRIGLLLTGVVALLIAAVAVLVLNQNKSKYDTELLVNAGELRVLSQEIAKNSSEASAR